MDEPTTPNTSLPSYIWMNFIWPYIKVNIQDNLQVKLMFLKQFKVVCTYQLSYTNLLKNNLKLYSLMIEVFGEHLILYYEKVTCRKQRLKQYWASTFAEWSDFTFSKLLWSEITGFTIHKVKFFFVKMSYSFYSFIYSSSIRLDSQEVTMVLVTASPTNLNPFDDINNKA